MAWHIFVVIVVNAPLCDLCNVREIQWNELIFVAVSNLFRSSATNLQV